jgi:uncharacterized protein YeaO (DUF488 family)
MTTMVKVRRVYEERARGDGRRILVDSLWPRGLSKSRADLDEQLPASIMRDSRRPGHR